MGCHNLSDEEDREIRARLALRGWPPARKTLFSLTDQPKKMVCDECGSTNIIMSYHAFMNRVTPPWPHDIHGHPGEASPDVETDHYGRLTSRTVRY